MRRTKSKENGHLSTKKPEKAEDNDDVGANGEETTDDEGGVDTPPPVVTKEEEEEEVVEEDSKANVTKPKGKKSKKNKKGKSREEEYEVEQIVDMEVKQRWSCPVRFRVRWAGYGEKDDTWLPSIELSCDALRDEFLEISGRKPEYEKALEAKKKALEDLENYRQSSRRVGRVSYNEVDEFEDEILPRGTKSRKLKTNYDFSGAPSKKTIKKSSKKVTSGKSTREVEYEVESIEGVRMRGGSKEYRVRWKGWSPKYDSWLQEEDLSCKSLIKQFTASLAEEDEEEYQVEKILDSRQHKGKTEYLVHWKGFTAANDTWEPVANLDGCDNILRKFKNSQSKSPKRSVAAETKTVTKKARKRS